MFLKFLISALFTETALLFGQPFTTKQLYVPADKNNVDVNSPPAHK